MVAMAQFGRVASVRVLPVANGPPAVVVNPNALLPVPKGTIAVPDLRVAFSVEKSTSAEPQRAMIQLVNLSRVTRDLLASLARRPQLVTTVGATVDARAWNSTVVELHAGYRGGFAGMIFRGALSDVRSRHAGTEWITELDCGDSEDVLTHAECDLGFSEGATALDVLTYALGIMGVTLAPGVPPPPQLAAYVLSRGFVAHGRARDTIDAILAGVDLDVPTSAALAAEVETGQPARSIGFFVEDGFAFFTTRGVPLPGEPVRLSFTTDPLGAARILERPERLANDGLRVRTLLHPGVRPGRGVLVTATQVAGLYRCEAVRHSGDNRGGSAFATEADLQPVAPMPVPPTIPTGPVLGGLPAGA